MYFVITSMSTKRVSGILFYIQHLNQREKGLWKNSNKKKSRTR